MKIIRICEKRNFRFGITIKSHQELDMKVISAIVGVPLQIDIQVIQVIQGIRLQNVHGKQLNRIMVIMRLLP